MREWLKEILANPTTSVPNAARALGIGRNQGYESVQRGEIPGERYGKRIVVPTAWLRRVLQIEEDQANG